MEASEGRKCGDPLKHPPGTIVIFGAHTARFHAFTRSLDWLERPEGTQSVFSHGLQINENINNAIRALRPQDEWVWVLGDDHTFAPDTLIKLLDREVDIIAPVCSQRYAPFALVHYDRMISDSALYGAVQYDELPTDGELLEVEATGSLLLSRREVFEAIGDPWYTNTDGRQNEDQNFCRKARAQGFKVWVDPLATTGHIGQVTATPECRDGVWGLALDFNGSTLFMPGGVDPYANLGAIKPKVMA